MTTQTLQKAEISVPEKTPKERAVAKLTKLVEVTARMDWKCQADINLYCVCCSILNDVREIKEA